jgi:dTDP-4-amino-4,6-dideoxygalactose transaminase
MVKRTTLLPFALPELGEAELREIKEVLESGWITTGPKAHLFEREFARYVGAKFAIAVNSCTAAMHLSLEAIGLQAGDFVLTTPYTFAATAEVIRYFDAVPVFVDVEPDTLNIDPSCLIETIEDLERCLGEGGKARTPAVARALGEDLTRPIARPRSPTERRRGGSLKAVIPVHIAGHPCEMDVILPKNTRWRWSKTRRMPVRRPSKGGRSGAKWLPAYPGPLASRSTPQRPWPRAKGAWSPPTARNGRSAFA